MPSEVRSMSFSIVNPVPSVPGELFKMTICLIQGWWTVTVDLNFPSTILTRGLFNFLALPAPSGKNK